MRKKLVCVSCPVGCELEVEVHGPGAIEVSGNRCPRGEAYAREEVTDPKRVLMSLVKVVGGERPVVAVRTDRPIPKRLFPQVMGLVRRLCLKAPVKLGQVVALAGDGAQLITTQQVREASPPPGAGASKSG
jgi:CxxC motif-containing protein